MRSSVLTLALDAIAEERIREAMRRGDFDDLPGVGQPVALDDDPLVSPELRVAYRILKNAGLAPPEVYERREIAELDAALRDMDDAPERKRALLKLALLRAKLDRRPSGSRSLCAYYERKITEKFSRGSDVE